jgi:dextranase
MEHTTIELLPTKAQYAPGDDVVIEVRGATAGAGRLEVTRLGDVVVKVAVDDLVGPDGRGCHVSVGPLAAGGYALRLAGDGWSARTAVAVVADPRCRLRYGFVANYRPGRDVADVADNVRRLHLTAVQFYDWAYRHADLVGGGDEYTDALDQPVSLDTVRRLVNDVQAAGASALGYAAVYGVGNDEWPTWQHDALLDGAGQPYQLGDFLRLVDPAAPDWSAHFAGDLAASVATAGFDGFHLDQYGYPRFARRADGVFVALADAFDTVISAVRDRLPDAHLVFNNVNDFPTWATAHSRQDAVYIEVWEPHVTLGDLGTVVARARAESEGKPVVIAAYQSVYRTEHAAGHGAAAADRATALTMATLFTHGATHLLAGEDGNVLVDPYYVDNHRADPSTLDLLRRWYDFLVAHDELLVDPSISDVTGSWSGSLNDLLDVSYPSAPVELDATPGSVWQRVTLAADRVVVHLVNLVGQEDARWDAARQPFGEPGPAMLRVRSVGPALPRIRVADPDADGALTDVAVRADGLFAVAELPALRAWQLVTIELDADPGGEPLGETTPCDSAFVSSAEPAERAKHELDAASGRTYPLKPSASS